MRKIEQKFELHKQYVIEYTICKKGAILREKYKNYTKIVLTNYAGFGNIPFLTVQKVKKAEKRDTYAKKRIVSFLPRFPKLS